MAINFKKPSCIRIGYRMDAPYATISSSAVITIPWVKELSYLGVHILQSRTFKCSLSNHRKAFYRLANMHYIWKDWSHCIRGCNFAVDKKQMHT